MVSTQVEQKFFERFQEQPAVLVRAAGRINLIGEHTDYNGGFVLPAAIDKAVYVAVGKRRDRLCHLVALDVGSEMVVSLDDLQKSAEHGWANYLMGVLDELKRSEKGKDKMGGINLVFGSDLPSGAGLSSSAAMENGAGFALNELFALGLTRLELVQLSQRAENNFVGMQCGIMDMFASMMGHKNQFVRIDCRSLEYAYFPFDAPDLCLVLCNTGVKHALVDSEYNTRRAECAEGVQVLQAFDPGIQLLRDVPLDFLERHKAALRPVVYRRCHYVVSENERVLQACVALAQGDFAKVGQLMFETHRGLSEDYEVSCPELDFLVGQARNVPGLLGSRMMGGGFGGCTINLVEKAQSASLVHQLGTAYLDAFGIQMEHYLVRPGEGVGMLE